MLCARFLRREVVETGLLQPRIEKSGGALPEAGVGCGERVDLERGQFESAAAELRQRADGVLQKRGPELLIGDQPANDDFHDSVCQRLLLPGTPEGNSWTAAGAALPEGGKTLSDSELLRSSSWGWATGKTR